MKELEAIVRPAEDLANLAKEINGEHEAGVICFQRGLEHYRAAGEALLRAKRQVGHGGWTVWVKQHIRFSHCVSARYMLLAKDWDDAKLEGVTRLDKALRILTFDDREIGENISNSTNFHQSPQPSEDQSDTVSVGNSDDGADGDGTKKTNWVDKRCEEIEWYTPEYILEKMRDYFGGPIPLDPATAPSNPTKAERFFTAEDDGLKQDWNGQGVFVNPPYGNVLPDWTMKIHEEAASGTPIIALLPCGARFSTGYWQDNILSERLDVICFVRGRVAFVDRDGVEQQGNPYDSAIYGYNVRPEFAGVFRDLGKVLTVKGAE